MRVRLMGRQAGVLASLAILVSVMWPGSVAAAPTTYVVTTAGDVGGSTCAATCSLRQAILAANANALDHDTITFSIPGGPTDIVVGSGLPAITDPVTIDGTTQPGVRLAGTALGGSEAGLHVQASGTIIRGLEIREFPGHGILLDGVHDTIIGGDSAVEGNTVTANGLDGVAVLGDDTAIGNAITANRIFANGEQSIDHDDDDNFGVGGDVSDSDTGPNGHQNTPSVHATSPAPVTEVTVSAHSRAFVSTARVDVYWSATCPFPTSGLLGAASQAEAFLGSIDIAMTTVFQAFSTGTDALTLPAPRSSGYISATTTTVDGTSELSPCERIQVPTDLAIGVVATPSGPVDVGTPITFEATISNNGPIRDEDILAGLFAINQVGAFTSVASSQGSCVIDDGSATGGPPTVYCSIGGLDPGTSAAITATFVLSEAVSAEMVAQVLDYGFDTVPENNIVAIPVVVIGVESIGAIVPDGGSATTDPEADGAAPDDPVETTVDLPAGMAGGITIAERPDAAPPPFGYAFAGQAVEIYAPLATAANPIVLTFLVDETVPLPDPVVVFRNGVPVADCAVADPGTDPSAVPDPCVLTRLPSGDDLAITVRTSATSLWRVGSMVPYDFAGFFSPVDMGGVLNRVNSGSAVPMKFSLGGNRGLGIFAAGSPSSAGATCGDAPVDPIEQTVTAGGSSLQYDAGSDRYTYVWKTQKAWAGTCRTFRMTFTDGSTAQAAFQFKK